MEPPTALLTAAPYTLADVPMISDFGDEPEAPTDAELAAGACAPQRSAGMFWTEEELDGLFKDADARRAQQAQAAVAREPAEPASEQPTVPKAAPTLAPVEPPGHSVARTPSPRSRSPTSSSGGSDSLPSSPTRVRDQSTETVEACVDRVFLRLSQVLECWDMSAQEAGQTHDDMKANLLAAERTRSGMSDLFSDLTIYYPSWVASVKDTILELSRGKAFVVMTKAMRNTQSSLLTVLSGLDAFLEATPVGATSQKTWSDLLDLMFRQNTSFQECLSQLFVNVAEESRNTFPPSSYRERMLELASYEGGVFMFSPGSGAKAQVELLMKSLPPSHAHVPGNIATITTVLGDPGTRSGQVYVMCASQLLAALKGTRRRISSPVHVLNQLKACHDAVIVTPNTLILFPHRCALTSFMESPIPEVLTVETDDKDLLAIVAKRTTVVGLLEHQSSRVIRICHAEGIDDHMAGIEDQLNIPDESADGTLPEEVSALPEPGADSDLMSGKASEQRQESWENCWSVLANHVELLGPMQAEDAKRMTAFMTELSDIRRRQGLFLDYESLLSLLTEASSEELLQCLRTYAIGDEGVGNTSTSDRVIQMIADAGGSSEESGVVPPPDGYEYKDGALAPIPDRSQEAAAETPENAEAPGTGTSPCEEPASPEQGASADDHEDDKEWEVDPEDDPEGAENADVSEEVIANIMKRARGRLSPSDPASPEKEQADSTMVTKKTVTFGGTETHIVDSTKSDTSARVIERKDNSGARLSRKKEGRGEPQIDAIPQPRVGLPQAPGPFESTKLGAKAAELSGKVGLSFASQGTVSPPISPDDLSKSVISLKDQVGFLTQSCSDFDRRNDANRDGLADLRGLVLELSKKVDLVTTELQNVKATLASGAVKPPAVSPPPPRPAPPSTPPPPANPPETTPPPAESPPAPESIPRPVAAERVIAVRELLKGSVVVHDHTPLRTIECLETVCAHLRADLDRFPPVRNERSILSVAIDSNDADLMKLLRIGMTKRKQGFPCLSSILLGVTGNPMGQLVQPAELTAIPHVVMEWLPRTPVVGTILKLDRIQLDKSSPSWRSIVENAILLRCTDTRKLANRFMRSLLPHVGGRQA